MTADYSATFAMIERSNAHNRHGRLAAERDGGVTAARLAAERGASPHRVLVTHIWPDAIRCRIDGQWQRVEVTA